MDCTQCLVPAHGGPEKPRPATRTVVDDGGVRVAACGICASRIEIAAGRRAATDDADDVLTAAATWPRW